ncbi:MAG: lysophospholipid acyltransferase family protein [Archangium sp.]|nr:lysophospholipid acyltransferase family protein [Archangium sp.]
MDSCPLHQTLSVKTDASARGEAGGGAVRRWPVTPRAPLWKRVKRSVRTRAIAAVAWVLALLPIGLAREIGSFFGWLAYVLAFGERRKALESTRVAFPDWSDAERLKLIHATFQHLGRCAFELVCVRQLDARVDDFIDWPAEDRRALDAALARKKGVLFISGHVGNWELLARRVALAGYPCQTIAKETSDPGLTALVERFRASANLKGIWRGHEGAAKAMLRALKGGEILGMLIDQDTSVQSLWVPFFGKPAKTPRAAADLALRTGAAVMLGFCQRTPSGKYLLRMHEVAVEATDTSETLTARLSLGIEAAIRAYPEQWVWMHRRWKSPPPSSP